MGKGSILPAWFRRSFYITLAGRVRVFPGNIAMNIAQQDSSVSPLEVAAFIGLDRSDRRLDICLQSSGGKSVHCKSAKRFGNTCGVLNRLTFMRPCLAVGVESDQ